MIVLDKYLYAFIREGLENETETQAGSGVVFTYLLHCVFENLLLSLLNNSQHLTHVLKDKNDLSLEFKFL